MNKNNFTDKLILITFLALAGSFLSALYISSTKATNIPANETLIQVPGTSSGSINDADSR